MATGLENLKIYKLAARLEVFIYKVTEKFPVDEKYNSVSQLRKSSLSVSNNIAESYGRYSFKSKINYLYIARGEVEETRSGIDRAYKKGFITEKMSNFIVEKYTELLKSVNSYIKFLKNPKTNN